MALIKLTELAQAQNSNKYQFVQVDPTKTHRVKIIYAQIEQNKFGGQTLNLVYEFIDNEGLSYGTHVRDFVTYSNKFGKISQEFVNFIGKFFDLSQGGSIETDALIGAICQIKVANRADNDWQKVIEVVPELQAKVAEVQIS